MALKVNLLPDSVKEIQKVNNQVALLKLVSEGVLGVFIGMVIGLFGWFFLTNQQIGSVARQKTQVIEQIQSLAAEELLYNRFVVASEEGKKIVNARKDFKGMLQEIYALVPTGSFVTDLNFTDTGVRLTVTSGNVHDFTSAVQSLSRAGGSNSLFGDVVLSDVSRAIEGRYIFTAELQLKSHGKQS